MSGAAKRATLGFGLYLLAGMLFVLAPVANGLFPSKDFGILYVLSILCLAAAGTLVLLFAVIALLRGK